MKNNKAISMISLVITIVLIIILAMITSQYLSSTMHDAQYKDVKEELKNVENVVEYAKTQILIDEFMPNEDFMISDSELDMKFGKILTVDEIDYIKDVNNSDDLEAPYKYYLMNQSKFDSEFGNGYNVSNLRPAREYLVNYMDTYVACNYDGTKVASSNNILPTDDYERAEITVAFTPDGNSEWQKQQSTMVSLKFNSATTVISTQYLWSQSYAEPDEGEFVENISDGQTVDLADKTGNDWYLWVCVTYNENGVEKTYFKRSQPFYVDNTAPSANLIVEDIER